MTAAARRTASFTAAAPTPRSTIRWAPGHLRYGINDAGQIVGFYIDSSGILHGFLYSGGTYTTLDDPLGTNGTDALRHQQAGQIVGYYIDSNDMSHGFLYSGGTYTTLDDPLGTKGTVASGINDAGQIVGYYFDSSGMEHGFLANPASRRHASPPRSSRKSLAFMRRSTTALPISPAIRIGSASMASNLTLAE